MRAKVKCTVVRGFILINLVVLTARAQVYETYNIDWSTIEGGGGPTSGGAFSIHGTIGQPDAGISSSGVFALTGGFWGGVSDISEPLPRLGIRRVGSPNQVVLFWANPSSGFVLQRLCDGGAWTDVAQLPGVVGANKEVTLQAIGQFCMFRLRRP